MKIKEIFLKIMIIISWMIFSIVLVPYSLKNIIFTMISIFIVLSILLFKYKFDKLSRKKIIYTSILTLYIDKLYLKYFKISFDLFCDRFSSISFLDKYYNLIIVLFFILCLPSIFFIINYIVDKIKPILLKEYNKIDKIDKYFMLIVLVISFYLSFFINYKTTAFGVSYYGGSHMNYDIIYTSDSSYLSFYDTWFNVACLENDIRQPLFGVFALPFSIIPHIMNDLFFFIPDNVGYELFMIIMQFFILSLIAIMLSKLMKIDGKEKIIFYLMLFVSYPFIIFGFMLEQYVIAVFYLLLCIYLFNNNYFKINYTYIGATGSLLTSGVLLPFICKYDNLKMYLRNVFRCFIAFMIVVILSGQLQQLLSITDFLSLLSEFGGQKISFFNKVCQYTSFIKGLFIPNTGHIVWLDNGWYPTYQLINSNSINYVGIIILVVLLFSFIINRKEFISKVSILWILFSIIILMIIGWGTSENGLILYSLYFGWAFYVLFYLLLKKIFKNKYVFTCVSIMAIICIGFFSIREFINIIEFAITYYPR